MTEIIEEYFSKLLQVSRIGSPVPLLLAAWLLWFVVSRILTNRVRSRNAGAVVGICAGLLSFIQVVRPYSEFGEMFAVLLRAAAVSWIVTSAMWVILASLESLYSVTIRATVRNVRAFFARWGERLAQRRRYAETEKSYRESQEQAKRRIPEEQRRTHEKLVEQRAAQDGQIRRENARLACELMYSAFLPDIATRFPKENFEAFVQKYMTDRHDAAEVERRGQDLQAMIKGHGTPTVVATVQPQNLDQLARWFVTESDKINLLPIDPDLKDIHIVQLNRRYEELSSALMQKIQP